MKNMRSLRRNMPFLLMAAPGFLLLVVFSYLPMFGVVIAFKNYKASKGIWGSDWIGLKNFEYLVRTPDLQRITTNTVFLNAIFILTGLIGAIGLALLLNEVRVKLAARVYQTVIFFPFIIIFYVYRISFYICTMYWSFINIQLFQSIYQNA